MFCKPLRNYILLIIMLCCCQKVSGQTATEYLKRLDSLMFAEELDRAQAETDSIISLFSTQFKGPAYAAFRLSVKLHQADLLVKQHSINKAGRNLLEIIDQAEQDNLPEQAYTGHLQAALMYELLQQFETCNEHLDKAYDLYSAHKLEHLYSHYCIRRSSYYRLMRNKQEATKYAREGLAYAKRFNRQIDITAGYMLLGILTDKNESIQYTRQASQQFLSAGNFEGAALMYHNISNAYSYIGEPARGFAYSDSALFFGSKTGRDMPPNLYLGRSDLYKKSGNIDSAYYYFKKYHAAIIKKNDEYDARGFKDITEKYENDKKETIIKSKDQQMIWIGALLLVIVIAAGLVIRKNRKINAQNKIINKQLTELSATLAQKKVLLSELQHRVKNNLQHVISILEMQKESVDFNNIQELIRSNQNRIYSLALLHKKLDVDESVNEVNLKNYITELSGIVKESYYDDKKKVNLQVDCEIEILTIANAMPLGLIVVELVSNSMKHAFKGKNTGLIHIDIKKDAGNARSKLVYRDDGPGFNFNTSSSTGLGLEIIKGLIDQLNGGFSANTNDGFELTIQF